MVISLHKGCGQPPWWAWSWPASHLSFTPAKPDFCGSARCHLRLRVSFILEVSGTDSYRNQRLLCTFFSIVPSFFFFSLLQRKQCRTQDVLEGDERSSGLQQVTRPSQTRLLRTVSGSWWKSSLNFFVGGTNTKEKSLPWGRILLRFPPNAPQTNGGPFASSNQLIDLGFLHLFSSQWD